MSESSDIGEGPDDKEAKRMKYSDPDQHQQQQDIEKQTEISPEGKESSSSIANPSGQENTEVEQKQEQEKTEGSASSGTEGSEIEQMIENVFGEENIAPVLPLKKREHYRTPESGSSEDDSEPVGILLFEIQLKPSNRLVIPEAKASNYFPPPSTFGHANVPVKLRITDIRNREWEMSVIYYAEEKAFMVVKGWKEFANWHKWENSASIVIGFYRPIPRFSLEHFLVKFERIAESLPFRRENFLFQVELNTGDIGYRRLFMPREEVEIHFPAIKHVEGVNRRKEIMRFTDGENKDWYMDVIYYDAKSYMIIEEWDEFVKEHNLEAMDVIKFYRPVEPLHWRHFLIETARKEAGTYPNRPGGDGPSGSGSYKGKGKMLAG